ncbi:MAG: phage/plasmid primase, P4 family, partial [Gemmatimonadaceae bacterium]|nr:phage/plasmid primase, P4 family [Gemmatimonadaceae bacterium]
DDIGNAERFIARVGGDVRETQRLGVFVWDGRRWALDDGAVAVTIKAQAVARAILGEAKMLYAEARALPDDGKDDVEKPKKAALSAAAGHMAWARSSANAAKLSAMVSQALPHLNVPLETWNATPTLFNTPDGVVDLASLEPVLSPHRREHFMTRMAATPFRPDAVAPLWRAFLEKMLPDPEIRAFVQRCLGCCLVDSASDQVVIVFHGAGANGKSTVLDVVCDVLGDYAMSASVQTFLAHNNATGSNPQPDVVRLAYRPRLVRTAEPPPGSRLAEGVIKEVTGGEPMVARDLQEKPIEFVPGWKLFISCNNLPSVRGGDDGIWRRILLVPWGVQIPREERDVNVKMKLLAEREGVLAWLLEGWADWHERGGLDPPAAVLAASELYRAESDPVGQFVNEWCERGPGLEEATTLLHDAFEAWCKVEGMEPVNGNVFGKRLSDRGYGRRKSSGVTYRTGLKLTPDAAEHGRDREADRLQRGRRTEQSP